MSASHYDMWKTAHKMPL